MSWGYKVVLITLVFFTGLAFAVLSSVHPVFGLYGSLFPAIIYAIFGMGHHVATGNNSYVYASNVTRKRDLVIITDYISLAVLMSLLKTRANIRGRYLLSMHRIVNIHCGLLLYYCVGKIIAKDSLHF